MAPGRGLKVVGLCAADHSSGITSLIATDGVPLLFGPTTYMGCQIESTNSCNSTNESFINGDRAEAVIFAAPADGVQSNGGYAFVKGIKVHGSRDGRFNWNDGPVTHGPAFVISQHCESDFGRDRQALGVSLAQNENARSVRTTTSRSRASASLHRDATTPLIADVGLGVS